MKTLHCADAGFDCQAIVNAETTEEVMAQAAEHARTAHGTIVTPEMAAQIATLIREN